MIQTFIALFSEQNSSEMKYNRKEAVISLESFTPNVTAGTHFGVRLLLYSF